MVYYWIDEKNEKWATELEILSNFLNMKQDADIIHKSSIYYPRLKETKKRGRHAFIELYKKLCIDDKKTRYMDLDNFELMICRHKNFKVHIQPTKRYGDEIETMWILETETTEHSAKYMSNYEYIMTPEMPYQDKEQDKVFAISTLIENLKPNKRELIKLLGLLVEELGAEQEQGDNL